MACMLILDSLGRVMAVTGGSSFGLGPSSGGSTHRQSHNLQAAVDVL